MFYLCICSKIFREVCSWTVLSGQHKNRYMRRRHTKFAGFSTVWITPSFFFFEKQAFEVLTLFRESDNAER